MAVSRRPGRASGARWSAPAAMLAAVALLPWAPAVVAAPLAWAQRNSPPLRVLFVGNSLTFTNDLPAIVAALADSAGRAVTVRSVTASGINLDAHWRGGTARRLLASEPWDVVVLQQGPSAMPASRAQLAAYARRFAAEIRRAGARPALYMVWPSRRRLAQLDEVRESYRLAARDVDGIFLPAGEAWRAAWRRDPSLPLYGPDGRHPSATGSYLAALVIAGRLLDRAPDEFPPAVRLADGRVVGVTASQAAVLEAAAAEALGRWR